MREYNYTKEILKMLKERRPAEVLEYVKVNIQQGKLTASALGRLFLVYLDVNDEWQDKEAGVSNVILIDDLERYNKYFRPQNGCEWGRSGQGLGAKYLIERRLYQGRSYSIQLIGKNEQEGTRTVRKDIKDKIKKMPSALSGSRHNIQTDHKNARYNDSRVLDPKTQREDDFQALTTAENDTKREFCNKCKKTDQRFDARILGFPIGYIEGDKGYQGTCVGCFWYDVAAFIRASCNGKMRYRKYKIKARRQGAAQTTNDESATNAGALKHLDDTKKT